VRGNNCVVEGNDDVIRRHACVVGGDNRIEKDRIRVYDDTVWRKHVIRDECAIRGACVI
jgi:hypothetical protein